MADPFRGKTLRWSYRDGPTAGKSFEHAFGRDGHVTWSMDGGAPGEGAKYEVARLTPTVHVASYLAPSGWTLTTALDTETGTIVSVASNEAQVFVQHGKLEREHGAARRATSRPRKATAGKARKAATARPR
jgi:hypothetical protein